jgi:valyl-tRNA synthetase
MPFLTEELWQRLPRRDGDGTLSIMLDSYPTFDLGLDDKSAEAEFEFVLDICRGIRSLVASHSLGVEAQSAFLIPQSMNPR